MQTLLQALAALEALYQQFGPAFEPSIIAGLEALKVKYPAPWEVALINAAEAVIRASLPAPAPAPTRTIGD